MSGEPESAMKAAMYAYIGVVWGVNVGIYGSPMECLGMRVQFKLGLPLNLNHRWDRIGDETPWNVPLIPTQPLTSQPCPCIVLSSPLVS